MSDFGYAFVSVANVLKMGKSRQEPGMAANLECSDSVLKCRLLASIILNCISVEEEGKRGRWK